MSQRLFGSAIVGVPLLAQYMKMSQNNQASNNAECADPSVDVRRAICVLDPQPNQTASGVVRFEQPHFYSKCQIDGKFKGLTAGKHGFHIHQFGDLTNGCVTAGPHYNPYKLTHGGNEDKERHVGDLGNIVAGDDGQAECHYEESLISLFGAFSVLGRSCVLHAGVDDLGKGGHELSKTTGNSGGRVACGVIGTLMQ